MDKYLSKNEEQLLELLETKSYEQLNEDEKRLVTTIVSRDEYNRRHSLLAQVPGVFEEKETIPLPLIIPGTKTPILKKAIPLYQVIVMAAAVCLLMFYLIPNNMHNTSNKATEYIVKTDTVEVEKRVVDTVIVTLEKPIYVQPKQAGQVNAVNTTKEEPRLLLPNAVPPFYMQDTDVSAKGSSMSNDKTFDLLIDIESESFRMKN